MNPRSPGLSQAEYLNDYVILEHRGHQTAAAQDVATGEPEMIGHIPEKSGSALSHMTCTSFGNVTHVKGTYQP